MQSMRASSSKSPSRQKRRIVSLLTMCERPRLVRWWPVLLVGIYALILAATAAVGTPSQPVPPAPAANLLDKPFGEDAFYMFSVARNIGTGQGVTYGGIPTTGIQPLATFLYASVYWFAAHAGLSATAPLRLILVLNIGLLMLTGWLCGKLVSRWFSRRQVFVKPALWIAAILVIVNAAAFRLFGYGLETGLYLCAIVALQLALDVAHDPLTTRDRFTIGLLLGVCILARLDFLIVGSVVFGWQLLRKRLRLRDALIIAAVGIMVVGPWLGYVYSVMGGIMPSSGVAESGAVMNVTQLLGRSWVMISAMVGCLSSVLYLPTSNPLAILPLVAVVLIGVYFIRANLRTTLRQNATWLIGAAALVLYYLFFSAAGHFYGRYLAPLWLFWTESLAASLALHYKHWPDRKTRTVMHLAGVALTILFAVQIGYTIHRGHVSNSHLYSALYIQEHAAELGTVGAFQNGVIGYINHERTINLDGKLDREALKLRGHLECYLSKRGISTVIDWPDFVYNGWIDASFVNSHLHPIGRVPGGVSIIMAVDLPAAGYCQ